ncbi:MAG: 50S ribosomal protein L11 methyltransferase, partial [Pseudomonadota bacterium]
CAEPGALKGRFDLILANLTAGPLIELASELGRLAAPAAHLGLSGILDSQAEAVVLAYQEQGFNWGSCLNQGGWTALWLFHGKTA